MSLMKFFLKLFIYLFFFFSHESYKNKSKNDNNKVNIDVLDSLRKDKSLVITKPDN